MDLNKLTPIELHELLYKIVKKLNKLPYVYNEKTRVTHNNYFVIHNNCFTFVNR
jgi:hypothetical protein